MAAVILDSMLSNSPGFLFALSALLLAMVGVVRLAQSCLHRARRWLGRAESAVRAAHS